MHVNIRCNFVDLSSSSIMAQITLLTADRNSSVEVRPVHCLKFFSHEICPERHLLASRYQFHISSLKGYVQSKTFFIFGHNEHLRYPIHHSIIRNVVYVVMSRSTRILMLPDRSNRDNVHQFGFLHLNQCTKDTL